MELRDRGITLRLEDSEIRRLCLAAGLMARVAGVDHQVSGRGKTCYEGHHQIGMEPIR